ncbi:MAG TPA: trypsin-like peptidase domain-containing protein, partial [Vicinamibacteria bacterium]|nr:trypsin-like peptidase domain-containing protein [Vicinamibacteria bacterium]
MKATGLLVLLLGLARTVVADVAAPPEEATVLIRVIGEVTEEYDRGWKQSRERSDVEIGTGSGFLISAFGHVLTNQHVVSGSELTVNRRGTPVRVKLEVKRIEVVLPTDGRRFEAAVDAADTDLDLALLSVTGAGLPFIPLGDSDVLEPGQPVRVLGFPFGREVEVGRAGTQDAPIQASVSRGVVAALRAGDEGEPRYIQTDASVNPGSSGGPMLDEEGYAVGVIRMRLGRGPGVGFAIPINRVKDFLEVSGLERVFPARRRQLGPVLSPEGKGLRLRLPEGLEDTAPTRLRLYAADPSCDLALHVDRLATARGLSDLEALLLSGQGSDGFVASGAPRVQTARIGGWPARVGVAAGLPRGGPGGAELLMEYALIELGKEKVLARWVGPAWQVAFNRSVLRGSLASLEADPLLTAELSAAAPTALEPASLPNPGAPALPWPANWVREPTAPLPCPRLPPPDSVLSASPAGDFTVSLRAAWWRAPGFTPEAAIAACAWPTGPLGAGSYSLRREQWGSVQALRGAF